jgi:hypothetical protein
MIGRDLLQELHRTRHSGFARRPQGPLKRSSGAGRHGEEQQPEGEAAQQASDCMKAVPVRE